MEPITVLTSLASALGIAKTGTDLLKQAADSNDLKKKNELLIEAQGTLSSLLTSLHQLQVKGIALYAENEKLKRKLHDKDDFENRTKNFRRFQAEAGGWVLKEEAQDEPFYCPECFEEKIVRILQDDKTIGGTYSCTKCKNSFKIRTIPLPAARKSGWAI